MSNKDLKKCPRCGEPPGIFECKNELIIFRYLVLCVNPNCEDTHAPPRFAREEYATSFWNSKAVEQDRIKLNKKSL